MSFATAIRDITYKTAAAFDQKELKAFVLCYHSIGNSPWKFAVSVEVFKQQIDYLSKRYKYLDLEQIHNLINGIGDYDATPAFSITFDDGYADILQIKDYLREKHIRPTLFLLSQQEKADRSQLNNDLKFLSPEQVKELIADGWLIGSHSATHSDFWKLDKYGINSEVLESKAALEAKFSAKIKYFSYPRGRYNPEIIKAVKQAGYEMALSMNDGEIDSQANPYLIPRIGVDKTHDFSVFKVLMLESVSGVRSFLKKYLEPQPQNNKLNLKGSFMKDLQIKTLNLLRIIRGAIVRTIKPKSGYFLFPAPQRNTQPISTMYGFDRGKPVDRYYIENFMEQNKDVIKGAVLEITDPQYTQKYGSDKVTKSDVLDIDTNNKLANLYGDLKNISQIPSETYDCLIITQTYVMIDDYEAAIRESLRVLKHGGALLVTMPCLSPVWNIKYHHWRFTQASGEYVFGKYIKKENLTVKTYGNALAGQAFWVGMAIEDLTKDEIEYNDPYFPVIVTIKAIKD